MLVLSGDRIQKLASLVGLIECLRQAFRAPSIVPPRRVEKLPGGMDGRLLLFMPAFDLNGSGVVKLATVFPDNRTAGLPTIQAAIVVFSETGTPIALLDGTIVTRLRTAATSGLASTYLSRADSTHLVIIGTGALAPFIATAHCTVRPISRISVCGRNSDRARAVATTIRSLVNHDITVSVPDSIEAAVATADIVSCSTSSPTPVLAGKWLKPGAFVDLVGSFSPSKREADDDVVRHSRIFVDTFEGALSEAGDILDPLERGVIDRERIKGELADLVCGRVIGRKNDDEITLFKSVGSAIEDLAATQYIVAAASQTVSIPYASNVELGYK